MPSEVQFTIKGKDTSGQAFQEVQTRASKLGPALAVAGAAAGAALTAGIASAMEFEQAQAKLEAQLGSTGPLSEAAGRAAGELYSQGYGASMEETSAAVGAVVTSIDGMRDANADAIQDMSAKAMTLAQVFGVDVGRAAQVAGQMITTGLAQDGAQAMDLLTASMQAVPAAVRGDLVDAIDEYGPFMQQIGVTGERAMGLLVAAAEDGMFGLDKTGDALKEFTIRATDMSATTGQAYETLGMDMQEMTNKLLAGGETGAQAFQQIVDGLLGIKDPAAQSQAALALFGTPLEDLNVGEIPQFLQGLQSSGDALGDFEGAAEAAGKTMQDTAANKMREFQRGIEQLLAGLVTAPGIIGDAATAVGGFGAAVLPIGADLGGLALAMGGVIKAGPAIKDAIGNLGTTFASLGTRARDTATGVANSFSAMSTAGKTATIGLGAIGIALTVAAGAAALFAQRNAEVQAEVEGLAATLDEATGAITEDTRAKVTNRLETEGVLEAAKRLGIGLGTVVEAAMGNKDAMDQVNDVLAEQGDVQRKAAFRAIGTSSALTEEEEAALLLTEKLPAMNEQLAEAAERHQRVAEGSEEATGAQTALDEQLQATTESVEEQWGNVAELTAKMDELSSVVLAARDAERGYEEALDSASEAIAENGETMDVHTEAGRANGEALDRLAEASLGLAQAMIENGASQDEVAAKLQAAREQIVATAEKMGMSKTQAEAYADSLGLIPANVATAVTSTADAAAGPVGALNLLYDNTPGAVNTDVTNTADGASAAVRNYRRVLANIPANKTTTITTVYKRVGRPAGGKQHGGVVGSGTPVLVGEGGPELVDLPVGSTVIPNGTTERILGGAAGGGEQRVVLELRSSGSPVDDFLVEALQHAIRVRGGGVSVLGRLE